MRPSTLMQSGIVGVGMLAGMLTTDARADWEYTRWGMSKAEVIEASHNAAVPAAEGDRGHFADSGIPALAADFRSDAYSFRVLFFFDRAGKLATVGLVFVDADPVALGVDLEKKYGKPTRRYGNPFPGGMYWETPRDQIIFLGRPGLVYGARESLGAKSP